LLSEVVERDKDDDVGVETGMNRESGPGSLSRFRAPNPKKVLCGGGGRLRIDFLGADGIIGLGDGAEDATGVDDEDAIGEDDEEEAAPAVNERDPVSMADQALSRSLRSSS
jgi:hypothetical protein